MDIDPHVMDGTPMDPKHKRACIEMAAREFDLDPDVVHAVARQEGGGRGTVRKNTDGTWDFGVMQLNSINVPHIQENWPSITVADLIYRPCLNILVGTWFLAERITRARGDVWLGVGNYHSATPRFHYPYRERVQAHYGRIKGGRP